MSYYSSASGQDSSSGSSSNDSFLSSSNDDDDDSSVDEPTIYHQNFPAHVAYRHVPFYQESVIIQDKSNMEDWEDATMNYAPERKSSFYPQVPKRLRYRGLKDDFSHRNTVKKHANHIYKDCTAQRNESLYRAYSKTLGKYVTQINNTQTGDIHETNGKEDYVSQGYFSTFDQDSINDCIDYNEYMTISNSNWANSVHRNRIEDNPAYYGNCIQVLRCSCTKCVKSVEQSDSGSTFPLHYLIHPRGQHLSISGVTINKDGCFELSSGEENIQSRSHCDVGGNIMQISCFRPDYNKVTVTARMSTHVSVISCDIQHQTDFDHEDTKSFRSFIQEKARFHPENYLPNTDNQSFKIIDVATRNDCSNLPPPFQSPQVFATLTMTGIQSPLHINGPTDIHLIQLNDATIFSVEHHSITNVDSISRIAFSDFHPKVLWSASRQNSNPISCQTKGFTKRSVLGYGHSLYSLDLRSDQASYLWSPSDDEFVPKNVHSVTEIHQGIDSNSPHNVYVSTSVCRGKVYLVDARMPAKTLCSWELPSMCVNSDGRSPGGVYGCGSILTKPLGLIEPIILGCSKEPGSLGTQLYRKPKRFGNFGTKTIELIALSGIGSIGNFALSSYFPIPDDSKGLFQNGLAAFSYGPASTGQNMCVLSSLSSGDIISQVLSPKAEFDGYEDDAYISQHISQDICLSMDQFKVIDPTDFIASNTKDPVTDSQCFENKIESMSPSFILGDNFTDFGEMKQYYLTDCVPSERRKRKVKAVKRDQNKQATPSENILQIADKLRSSMFNTD